MMHDESARGMARVSNALDRIDWIVGVPSCCSWMMIREVTRPEASFLDEHVWDATMAGPWASFGALGHSTGHRSAEGRWR